MTIQKLKLFGCILLFLGIDLLYPSIAANPVVNKTDTSRQAEPRFFVEAGRFNNENSALQLKLKLSATLKQPVNIEHPANSKDYLVKIGPIQGQELANHIRQLVSHDLQATDASSWIPTPGATSTTTAQTQAQYPQLRSADSQSSRSNKKLWNLRNAEVREVIAEVSRVTGKNFIIDPRVQGKISIVSSTPITNKELYQVFLSMLQISGYAAIPNGKIIKIVPNIDAKISAESPGQHPQGDEMLVAVVPVHYVPAEQLVPVLRPLMPQWSNVAAYPASNMLILSGRANNIRRMMTIIKQVDNSSSNGVDIVPLKYALAMDLVNTLKDLVKPQTGSNLTNQGNFSADDRSNSILVSGSRTERLRLKVLISQLDRQSPYGINSNTQVVYLHYLRAQDLAPILAGIAQANFSGTVGVTIGSITQPEVDSTDPSSNFANNAGANAAKNPFASSPNGQGLTTVASPNTAPTSTQNQSGTKPTVQIIAEPNTNSIIINAPPSVIRILKTVINQLDIRPAQLLIEALVAEVDESDVKDLGIEWGSNQQTGKAGDFRPGFAIINSKTNLSDFQAQIYALARERKANILSTPSVVVLDNRQAKILVGRQLSVATTSYPNNAGGTTTASPFSTFDRVNVALHLYVRPQITRGQGVQLQIDQGNDTLDPTSLTNNNDFPIFKISAIVTSVHVESGDIVVLGGLIQDSLAEDDNRLPIVGDIPGIGRLFQRNIRNREKRVLMVFIKPIILRDPNATIQVSGDKYRGLREHQLNTLRAQDFVQSNDKTILPALRGADLPTPFANPPPRQETIFTKPLRAGKDG